MTIHRPSVVQIAGTISIPDRHPDVLEHDFATQGLGDWGAPGVGHARSVVNGAYHAEGFGNDDNHLTSKGGPGRVHLMTFANHPYLNYTTPAGELICSDFTNAKVSMEVRGVNGFQLAANQKFIVWITANHPDFPPYPADGFKIANWGFVGEPREITGDWAEVSWVLDPEGEWVFGAGLGIYDQPLSLRESLQNIHNLHVLVLGPDDAVAPSGAFEMRNPKIVFNRNGPGLPAAVETWDASTKASAVTLTSGNLQASHGPFSSVGGVRGNTQIVGKKFWTGKMLSGNPALCFAFGVCNTNYLPGGTFFADTANGWGFLTDQAIKRNGVGTGISWGSAFAFGDTYMVAVDEPAGKLWFGRNGTWFNGGDPENGANPAYTNLTGDLYPVESNGTGNGSWVWRANFSGPFEFAPPAGFTGF